MAATALLRFEQGALVGANGEALIVAAGVAVEVRNSDNTDVNSWRIELLYAPPGSVLQQAQGIVPGAPYVLAQSSNGAVPAATVTPEAGFEGECYRIRLRVWSATNYSGTMSEDIRCVAVPYGSLLIVIPPYQKLPDPLPLVGMRGLANERPSETNFGGNPWGWSGGNFAAYGHRLVNEILRRVGRGIWFNDLVDVEVSTAIAGDSVVYDGATWVPGTPSGGPSTQWLPPEVTLGFDFTDLGTITRSNVRIPPDLRDWTFHGSGDAHLTYTNGIYEFYAQSSGAPGSGPVYVDFSADMATADPWDHDHENIGVGYRVFGAVLHAGTCPWAFLKVSGNTSWGWFDLTNGVPGSYGGTALDCASGMIALGDGWYWCWVSGRSWGGGQLWICPAESDGAIADVPSVHFPDTAPLMYAMSTYQDRPGVLFSQPRVKSIESIGSRKLTRAQQTYRPTSMPAMEFNPFTRELAGVNFSDCGVVANISLDITEPGGNYDLLDELSEPGSPWALYIVASAPDTNSGASKPAFVLTDAGTRILWAGFREGNWVLSSYEGGELIEATIAHGSPTKQIFAAYFRASSLNARVGAAHTSVGTKQQSSASRFIAASLGGGPFTTPLTPLGNLALQARQFGWFLVVGDVSVGSAVDSAIVAALISHYEVTP